MREKETKMKRRNRFPTGWDEARVQSLREHYESQTEEAVAEGEGFSEARSNGDGRAMGWCQQSQLITREKTVATQPQSS
jgi:hypothetical protein